jgi:hypothetical protein
MKQNGDCAPSYPPGIAGLRPALLLENKSGPEARGPGQPLNPTDLKRFYASPSNEEPMSETPIQKPAIRSLTLQSAAAIAIAAAAERLGVVLPEGAAQELAAAFIELVVTLGLIGVAVGRARARTPIV